MDESKLNLFLNNVGNRTLVFVCSVLTSLLCVAPFLTSYVDARAERLEAETFRHEVGDLEATLTALQAQSLSVEEAVDRLQSLLVTSEQIETLRHAVTSIVRNANCRLQSLTFADREARTWIEGDHPLSDDVEADEFDELATPYLLESQVMSLVINGKYSNLRQLIATVSAMNKLLHSESLEIHAEPGTPELTLRWDIKVFNIADRPIDEFDD